MALSQALPIARTNTLLDFWRRFRRNRAAVAGLGTLGCFAVMAILAPWLAPADPFQISGATFVRPSTGAWLGTDNLGRDILSQIIWGARVSLVVGLLAAATATAIGTLIGSVAGYFGGAVDATLMRIAELFQILPRFFLALVMVALFGAGIGKVIVVIGILSWPPIARLVRGQFLSVREQDFVEAARALGFGTGHIIFREALPNVLPPVIVAASLDAAQAVLLEASLSFFGLGDPTAISWGYLVNAAQPFLRQAWWMSTFPGLAICLIALSFNLVGDGLNDAINPRLRER